MPNRSLHIRRLFAFPSGISAFLAVFVFCAALIGFGRQTSFAAVTPGADTRNVKELVARLQRHYQATESFSAKFTQTLTRAGALPAQRSGVIYYQKPGKLRWEFEQPQPELIVSDGKTIFDYDQGLNQVVETPLKQAVKSQAAAAFLLGVGNVQRDFTAARVTNSHDNGLAVLSLTPRSGGQQIEAGIDPKTCNIMSLAISDPMGNRTEFSFSDIQLNQPVKSSLFKFTPPAGADIVSGQGGQ